MDPLWPTVLKSSGTLRPKRIKKEHAAVARENSTFLEALAPETTRRVVYRTHVSMGRSFDSSFPPTKTNHVCTISSDSEKIFSPNFGRPFWVKFSQNPSSSHFFLHSLLFTRVDAVSWLKLWHVEFSPLHPTRPSLWKCKRTGSSVAWTYELQEKWQQRSINVCMEVLGNSRVAWTLLPHPTLPHPTISHQTFQKRTKNWYGFQPVGRNNVCNGFNFQP